MADDPRPTCCGIAGGDARRALTSLEAAAGARGRDRRRSRPITWRSSSRPSTAPPSATTATATSTTTSPAPSSSPSAAPTSTPPCTTWPAWSRPARTPASSPAAWSSRPARTSAWPTPPPCRPPVAAMQAVSFIGWPEAQITLAHAVIHLSLAPKSNSAVKAIGAALATSAKAWPAPSRRTSATPLLRRPVPRPRQGLRLRPRRPRRRRRPAVRSGRRPRPPVLRAHPARRRSPLLRRLRPSQGTPGRRLPPTRRGKPTQKD